MVTGQTSEYDSHDVANMRVRYNFKYNIKNNLIFLFIFSLLGHQRGPRLEQ